MRYRLDRTWARHGAYGRVVLAGSPLRLFRLTDAGASIVDEVVAGADVGWSPLVDRLLDGGAIHPLPDIDGAHEFTTADVTTVTPQLDGSVRDDGRLTVDDGSIPPLTGAAIRLERNRGPAAARNVGRRRVTTPLVAFVDADVELSGVEAAAGGRAHAGGRADGASTWLDALLPHFDDPRVGLVAPRVIGEPRSSLDLGEQPARIRAGTRVSYVPAAAIVVRAEAFDDVGGFDEQLRYGEDVDLVWRLDEAGWRCRYEPDSQVWHRPRPSRWARIIQQVGYGSSAAPLALRHPHSLAPFRSNGWTAAVCVTTGLGHPVIALALATSSAAALVPKLRDVDPRRSFQLAMHGHLAAFGQAAAAIRRAWWPIVAVLGVVSKRSRMIAFAAVIADAASTPDDIAYGWGVWRGMLTHRTWRPIRPTISAWPPRHASRPARSSVAASRPGAGAR